MARVGTNNDGHPLSLLKRVLITHDPQLLQQVRSRATEIVTAMDSEDEQFTEEEIRSIAQDPGWLAQVYEALGSQADGDVDVEELEIEAAIEEIHADHDSEIAQAFSILTDSLPSPMVDWAYWFGTLPDIEPETAGELYARWSELGTGRDILDLTRHGITPVTFFETAAGLQLLLERYAAESSSAPVALLEFGHASESYADRDPSVIGREQLLAQVRSSPDCPPGAEGALLMWTCSAAARRPRMFSGFQVLGASGAVLAVAADTSNVGHDLMHR